MYDSLSSTESVLLERVRYNFECAVDRHGLSEFRYANTEIRTHLDHFTQHAIVMFHHQVYAGKPQTESHTVKYPRTWCDAFKLQYKKFFSLLPCVLPVEYATVDVKWQGTPIFPEVELIAGRYREVVVWKQPDITLGSSL